MKAATDKAQAVRADLDGLPIKEAAREVKEAEQELAKQRELSKGRIYLNCPHCSQPVVVNEKGGSGGLGRGRGTSSAREEASRKATVVEGVLAERVLQHGALQESASKYQVHARQRDNEVGEAKTALAIAEKLAGNAGAEVDTADRRADLMQVEQAVDDAKRVAGMVKAEALATELAETITRYSEIVRSIGPQGVRAKMMEAGLKKLNAGLSLSFPRLPFGR